MHLYYYSSLHLFLSLVAMHRLNSANNAGAGGISTMGSEIFNIWKSEVIKKLSILWGHLTLERPEVAPVVPRYFNILHTGRFVMYSWITKLYYRKTVGHVLCETCTDRRNNSKSPPPPPSKLFFIIVHVCAARRCECM